MSQSQWMDRGTQATAERTDSAVEAVGEIDRDRGHRRERLMSRKNSYKGGVRPMLRELARVLKEQEQALDQWS